MPSKPYSSRTWIIWSSGLESLVDSLGWVMRGSPFACLVTNVLGDRLWPTLSSRPPGFAFFATLKRRSRALLPQGYLQNKRYTNCPGPGFRNHGIGKRQFGTQTTKQGGMRAVGELVVHEPRGQAHHRITAFRPQGQPDPHVTRGAEYERRIADHSIGK